MSVSSQFYLEQAARCARDASVASLDNQREILLRSEAAWQAMAERAIRTDAERVKRDAARTPTTPFMLEERECPEILSVPS